MGERFENVLVPFGQRDSGARRWAIEHYVLFSNMLQIQPNEEVFGNLERFSKAAFGGKKPLPHKVFERVHSVSEWSLYQSIAVAVNHIPLVSDI